MTWWHWAILFVVGVTLIVLWLTSDWRRDSGSRSGTSFWIIDLDDWGDDS